MRKSILLYGILIVLMIIAASTIYTKYPKNNNVVEETNTIKDDSETIPTIDISKEKDEYISNLDMIAVELKEEAKNKYYFDDQKLKEGEIILLTDEYRGLSFKKGDLVSVDFNIDSDGSSDIVVGYFYEGLFTKVLSDSVPTTLGVSFKAPKDGDYTICILGYSDNNRTITNGLLSIR